MLSLVLILLLVKKGLITFQFDLLPFLLLPFENALLSIFGNVVEFFFVNIGQDVSPRRLLKKCSFRFLACLLSLFTLS